MFLLGIVSRTAAIASQPRHLPPGDARLRPELPNPLREQI